MPPVRGDQRRAAFEQFVDDSTASLLRTAYLVTGDTGQAEDLVQESFFKIARRWARVVSMENPRGYARRIVINLALDDSRRRSRHRAELAGRAHPVRSPSRPWEAQVTGGAVAAADDRLELVRALGELSPRQRAVLVLRYFDDLTESETASTLGCSVGTVKSTTSRALEKMRQLVPDTNRRDEPAQDVLLGSERKGEQR